MTNTRPRRVPRRASTVVAMTLAVGLVAACQHPPTPTPSPSVTDPRPSTTPTSAVPTGTTSGTGTPQPVSPTSSAPQSAGECATSIVAGLSASERAGQLLMVGLDDGAARTSLDGLVRQRHLGGVILLGGWYSGASSVRATTRHLQGLAGESTGGMRLFLAADQEGGSVQQLRGPGFTRMPSALTQGGWSREVLTTRATQWAKEIRQAGIAINLAPVADTVPTSVGRANQPIGRWGRQYSSDPVQVSSAAGAFIDGMHAGGVAATIKHFPGLGRITGNTDLTASGITDRTTTSDDAYLQPFAAGIADGAELVMVGSAIYSRIDPGVNAVFSRRVVTGLLREKLGYGGVVVTDDVGAAKAVAATPVGERATRFVAAGGDIVLTARASTVRPMHDALVARMRSDAGFAAAVQQSVTRVVRLKLAMGLADCR